MAKAKSKKKKRKKTKQKPQRKKTNALRKVKIGKYHASYPAKVRMLIVEMGVVNERGDVKWGTIAKLLGVTNKTILQWRKKSGKYYHEEFAKACFEGIGALDSNDIKRGLINISKPHKVVKRVRVLKQTGVKPPPKSWRKSDVLAFARIRLGIEIDPELSLPEIRLQIEAECESRAGEKLVVVREEETKELNVAAAKMTAANVGPEDERWMPKEGRVHGVTGGMARLLEEIGQQKTVLPAEELGIMEDDGKRASKEHEEPAVAAEQSVLDHG